MKKVTLPPPLRFFSSEEYVPIPKAIDQFPYFLYELSAEKTPWLEKDHGLKEILTAWEELIAVMEEKHRLRQKDVKEEMDALLALFFMALFWTNESPAAPAFWEQKEAELNVKPINFRERFQFIVARPYTYAAFRQLTELMNEQRKAAAVQAVRKR
ncbi:hypothetical protein BTO30_04375 [Domibacillus antri]|uniref:YpoC-like domain-containing protein n=1 Tax=Domibacillus antri TaxID=1714264 RepID=A0A1Q8Q790_9BACI|nr:hypothetical protein [Domibacillus antri]OLN23213.1 hypothetical protein BTO30_04375 [Domibacillus antri]